LCWGEQQAIKLALDSIPLLQPPLIRQQPSYYRDSNKAGSRALPTTPPNTGTSEPRQHNEDAFHVRVYGLATALASLCFPHHRCWQSREMRMGTRTLINGIGSQGIRPLGPLRKTRAGGQKNQGVTGGIGTERRSEYTITPSIRRKVHACPLLRPPAQDYSLSHGLAIPFS
jgi:hypothetical protein